MHCTDFKWNNETFKTEKKEILLCDVMSFLGGLGLHCKFQMAIKNTSFWKFLVKFGHKGH